MPLRFCHFYQTVTGDTAINAADDCLQTPLPGPALKFVTRALLLGALAITQVLAQEPPGELEPVPEPPPIPSQLESGEALEAEVTIIRRGETMVEEYRVNGRLMAIKVIPDRGTPYFLVDADGDGDLESRRSELGPHLLIPSWVIFSW